MPPYLPGQWPESIPRHVMPFGMHKGKPLDFVPTDYLEWLLANAVHFGSGLRAALRDELTTRGKKLNPEPPAPQPHCRHCPGPEGEQLRVYWQGRLLRADCARCGRYVKMLPKTAENIRMAGPGPSGQGTLDLKPTT